LNLNLKNELTINNFSFQIFNNFFENKLLYDKTIAIRPKIKIIDGTNNWYNIDKSKILGVGLN
jgi:hypothetical protein